jgi:Tfp pilus assembly protein PilN
MIKVNLLRDQTARVRKTTVKPSVSSIGLMLAVIAVLAAAAMGAWWYTVSRQITTLTGERDRLRIENARLQALRKEINEYEKAKRLRETRIQVIENLKEFQTGPVRLLNNVLHSIPRDSNVWLTFLDQKGERIQITGYAHHSESIPDFMSSLATSGYFKTVDLETIEEEKEAAKFSLVCVSAERKMPTE